MELCNLGTLVDGPARTMLLRGKGTALIKNLFDLRPVVTWGMLLRFNTVQIFGVCVVANNSWVSFPLQDS